MEEPVDTQEGVIPLNKLARIYRRIRTKMQEMEKEHERAIAELEAQRDEVANAMKEQLLASGSKSVRTDEGTVMITERKRFYASDWEEMKTFILENEAIDLLEKRISQTNMAQFLEQNPDKVPAGLNSVTSFEVTVRKPTGK
jgi:predicted nuclease with TOPRIM domain